MTEPAWALGYPLDFLSGVARTFREEFKPHTYGAFGIPKERDIATARHDGDLLWTGEPPAVAIARVLKVASTHQDFCGREARMKPGDIFVKALAGAQEGKNRILDRLVAYGRPLWLEGHVENPRLAALMAYRGFVLEMTKISASSDLKGLWLRADAPARALRSPPKMAAIDRIALAVGPEEFASADERQAVLDQAAQIPWAQHYSGYNKRRSWTAVALHGYDRDDPSFIIKPAEMSKAWKAENIARLLSGCGPTALAEAIPAAMTIASRIPGPTKQRIRLMRLAPGDGELTRHADITDPEAGTRDGQLMRIHIPIQTNEACIFTAWDLDGRKIERHFPAGALCYLDTRKPHAVINGGARDRIHLVVDTFASDRLRSIVGE